MNRPFAFSLVSEALLVEFLIRLHMTFAVGNNSVTEYALTKLVG